MKIFITYIIAVNLLAAILFTYDKVSAIHHRRRIPEQLLHLFELLGGIFTILPLIYLIHHKNRKRKYLLPTYTILILWIALLILIITTKAQI